MLYLISHSAKKSKLDNTNSAARLALWRSEFYGCKLLHPKTPPKKILNFVFLVCLGEKNKLQLQDI
jgi:hypothetical protein